ncbi:MAG: hypothetical protein J7M26_00165, partial [Armatimonadetes bacterium]|nr:hypothetical protein [Armatimonadota bacterium]
RWARRALAEKVELFVGGRQVATAAAIKPGEVLQASVPRRLVQTGNGQGALEVRYRVLGSARKVRLEFALPPAVPAAVAAPEGTLAAFAVSSQPTLGPAVVTLQPPKEGWPAQVEGSLVVRDAAGRQAPAAALTAAGQQASKAPVVAVLPSPGKGPFFVTSAEAAPPTDLAVEKLADGKVRVRNSEVLVTFDPAAGGTVTELRWRSGRNMARKSFGASWGRFGRFDPLHPRISSDKYLAQERKRYQADGPAQVEIALATPACVRVQARQVRPDVVLQQVYDFWAYVPYFRVTSTVQVKERFAGDEVAVLDVPLERGEWNKIFPNFTGIVSAKPAIHGGWRQGPYVPPYATIMQRGSFLRSLSLVDISTSQGVGWWRQGFYPQRRGKVGTIDTARVEIVARHPRPGALLTASATVLLHDGYQVEAERAERELGALRVQRLAVQGTLQGAAPPTSARDWWCQAYDVRMSVEGNPQSKAVEAELPASFAGKWLNPDSLRAVWQGGGKYQVLESLLGPGNARWLRVTVRSPQTQLGAGRLYIYARLQDQRPALLVSNERGVPDASFERGAEGWSKAPNALDHTVAHTGQVSVRLEAPTGGYSLLATQQVLVRPQANHVVSFWAKTKAQGAMVVVNFYGGEKYDFHHVDVRLKADGQWHKYQVVVPAGDFPAGMRPLLRIWVYHHPGPVWIDDVSCQAPEVPASQAHLGKIERLLR